MVINTVPYSAGFREKNVSSTAISVVIPTYRRERLLIETIRYLITLRPSPVEVLIVDQTSCHERDTERALTEFHERGIIRWLKLSHPSITAAMNLGLNEARGNVVLFLDDDIKPDPNLIRGHVEAHESNHMIVAGQVLQPGEQPSESSSGSGHFRFSSRTPCFVSEFMGGNFSISRDFAISLGGFDENFVRVAYRFEAEFAQRALASGARIYFQPSARINHLKATDGGTRSFGYHLTTARPSHTVGAYYHVLRSNKTWSKRMQDVLSRPLRSISTKHHAKHPWWIPATLISEMLGFIWAVTLYIRGPRLIRLS